MPVVEAVSGVVTSVLSDKELGTLIEWAALSLRDAGQHSPSEGELLDKLVAWQA